MSTRTYIFDFIDPSFYKKAKILVEKACLAERSYNKLIQNIHVVKRF